MIKTLRVEINKTLHRAFNDVAHSATTNCSSLNEQIFVVVSDRANEIDIQIVVMRILLNIAFKERYKRVEHKIANCRLVYVLQ
jgi:hypothetical protein